MGKVKDIYIDSVNEGLIFQPRNEAELFGSGQPNPLTLDDANIKNAFDDIKLKKSFARRTFKVTCTWMTFLILLGIAQFFLGKSDKYGLSETEFITLFTSSTVSVFTFWGIVGRYLFHRPK